jgi:hypothetical protein
MGATTSSIRATICQPTTHFACSAEQLLDEFAPHLLVSTRRSTAAGLLGLAAQSPLCPARPPTGYQAMIPALKTPLPRPRLRLDEPGLPWIAAQALQSNWAAAVAAAIASG